MRPLQVLPIRNRVDMGVMAMKGYSTFPKAPGLKPRRQMLLSHTQDTSFIWPIDETRRGTTAPAQSEHGINGNEGVFNFFQNFSSLNSPSGGLVPYSGHSLVVVGVLPSGEMLLVYSIAQENWTV